MKHCQDIKNDVQRYSTAMRLAGASNEHISKVVGQLVAEKHAGKDRTQYECTCDNWGPRFGENSLSMCCPGCWALALDYHQEMKVNGVEPVTMEMVERSTWGFNVNKLKEIKNGY